MVKLRKLTGSLITFHPRLSGEPVLQTNGLLERPSVFGRFWSTIAYQVLPLLARNVHRTGSNRALRAGFARPILLKRVKSFGSCQSVIGAHFVVIAKGACNAETRRHRGEWETLGNERHLDNIFLGLFSVSPCLRGKFVTPSAPFRGSSGATASPRGQSIDSTMVARQAARPKEPLHAEFKGLTNYVSGERRVIFSGAIGRRDPGEGYLLIQQWLLENLMKGTGEGLLDLRDLLTAFAWSPDCLFENEPALRALFCAKSHQIPPFASKNVQIMAENARFLRPILADGRSETVWRWLSLVGVSRRRCPHRRFSSPDQDGDGDIADKLRRCEVITKGLSRQRHRGTEENGKRRETKDIFM